MSTELLKGSLDPPATTPQFGMLGSRSIASYERELLQYRSREVLLRQALVRERALLREKDAQLKQQALFTKESDHRLLNDLQIVVSLLLLQSRAAGNGEIARQLKTAADRVGMIVRLHQRLHSHDGAQTVAFKRYLSELCQDFSAMTSAERALDLDFDTDDEIELPAATAISLGFIVSELLTNAAKHGKGRITVKFGANSEGRYELSVSNDGPPLPESFDAAAGKGLGMKIIRSFVDRIGGRFRVSICDGGQGVCFAVTFS